MTVSYLRSYDVVGLSTNLKHVCKMQITIISDLSQYIRRAHPNISGSCLLFLKEATSSTNPGATNMGRFLLAVTVLLSLAGAGK